MPNKQIARPSKRQALFIAQGQVGKKALIVPLYKIEKGELDQLVRGILAKGGVTEESEVQTVIEKVEESYEARIHVAEARAEVRRLMKIRAAGGKLMQSGYRKWKQVFYPAIKPFKESSTS